MKRILLVIFTLFIGIIVLPNKVIASIGPIHIGIETVNYGESKNIYGGTVTYNTGLSGPQLTLENVNITDYFMANAAVYTSIYTTDSYVIKLVGNNTITSTPNSLVNSSYYGAYSDGEINVVGNGILNINITNYVQIMGLYGDYVHIGENDKTGPTINANLDGPTDSSYIVFAQHIGNIYNSTLKLKLKGALIFGIVNEKITDMEIKDSDINIEIITGSESIALYYEKSKLLLENVEMLIKGKIATDAVNSTSVATSAIMAYDLLQIKNSKIVSILDGNDRSKSLINDSTTGTIELTRDNNHDFIFLTNAKFNTNKPVTYTGIDNTTVYTSDISLDKVASSNTFDLSTLKDKKYIIITDEFTNKIVSGNNQKLNKDFVTSYSFKTNHFRYLVKNIKLNNTELDSEDYKLEKDGTITLTTTGIDKLKVLSDGNYKIEIDYYYGNSLTFNLTITSGYKISFNVNGGTGTMSDISNLTGTYTLPTNTFTAPVGKQFKGWSLTNDGDIITTLNMTENKEVFAIWETIYTYEYINGDNQKFIKGKLDSYTFTIDGDYNEFESLKIGDISLVRDIDYTVAKGSTIITLRTSGINKLNALTSGTYNVETKFTDKTVTGKIVIKNGIDQKENPQTGDGIISNIILENISLISLVGCGLYINKKKKFN